MALFADFESTRIFPAIDLRGGRCVRLVRGKRDQEIHYGDDPVAVAQNWEAAGAECLHVIDLGAALGEPDSAAVILSIARVVRIPLQVGGGIRDDDRASCLLDGGVGRIIVGTRALEDADFLARLVTAYGESRVVVSIDCEGERVKIGGWEEDSPLGVHEAVSRVRDHGVRRLLVTATDRDGTFHGPRVDLYRDLLETTDAKIVAAGGIGDIEHVQQLLALRNPRLEGIVVGRALYENRVDLREALRAAAATQLDGPEG